MKTLTQIEPRTAISALPSFLNAPGSFYLTTNLTGVSGTNGITIAANNVTLDLNGFELVGAAGSSNAIAESGLRTNLVVHNGTIRNWTFSALGGGNLFRARIENIHVSDNGGGINVGAGSIVRNCVVTTSGQIGIRAGASSSVTDCSVQGSTSHGIEVGPAGTLARCVAYANGGAGFNVLDDGNLEQCTARQNTTNGFNLGNFTLAANCFAVSNTASGFVLAHNSSLMNCVARGNTRDGIIGSTGNAVNQCTASFNRTNGISLDYGGRITGCTVVSNLANGILVTGRSFVNQNQADGNGTTANHGGILVTVAENRIEGNHLTGNEIGLLVNGNFNFIAGNKASLNGTNFSFAASNVQGPFTANATNNFPWANFSY